MMAAALFGSCNVKENKELKSKVDSLNVELNISQQAAAMLSEVGVMLDSIESSRMILRSGVVEGTDYKDYAGRMKNLNAYIKETQIKWEEMESTLKKAKASSASYAAMVKKMKSELEMSTQQVAALQIEIENYRTESKALAKTVIEKDSLLTNKAEIIQVNEQNIAALETKVQTITINATPRRPIYCMLKARRWK
jgi:chromosome segregation ATPase